MANSICWSVRFPWGFVESCSDRISRLLRGVRSSCDMLARNSDLYLEVRASCSAFSSTACFASSTSSFLRATSAFCWVSNRAFSSSSSLVTRSSCCWLCSSFAIDCDCWSNSPVRMLASIVFITMPTLSVSWSRNARCVGLKRSKLANSITALTWVSKTTGSTTILRGAASPRADVICT